MTLVNPWSDPKRRWRVSLAVRCSTCPVCGEPALRPRRQLCPVRLGPHSYRLRAPPRPRVARLPAVRAAGIALCGRRRAAGARERRTLREHVTSIRTVSKSTALNCSEEIIQRRRARSAALPVTFRLCARSALRRRALRPLLRARSSLCSAFRALLA